MRFLLVGNGPAGDLARASAEADSIIQINTCRHASQLDAGKTHHVFIVNMGQTVSAHLCETIHGNGALLANATIMLTRNPFFYAAKRAFLQARSWHQTFHDYQLTESWKSLVKTWPIERISAFAALRLERKMRRLGMDLESMPSTGMIAYDWLHRRLKPGDTLTVEGFTFEGWKGHPWAIESQLIRSVDAVSN